MKRPYSLCRQDRRSAPTYSTAQVELQPLHFLFAIPILGDPSMSKIENIKSHLKNNKVTYIACGVTAVVVGGVTYYVTRNPAMVNEVAGSQIIQYIKQGNLNWKSNQVVVNLIENSTPSKPLLMEAVDG